MNYTRIVVGGLLAGVLMNVMEMFVGGYLFGMDKQWQDALTAIGKPIPTSGGVMATFLGLYFVLGILCAWMYGAIRPRFGAGPLTAIRAGFAVWLLGALLPTIVNLALNIYPARTLHTYLGLSLVEMILGTLLAGWIYKEGETATPSSRGVGA